MDAGIRVCQRMDKVQEKKSICKLSDKTARLPAAWGKTANFGSSDPAEAIFRISFSSPRPHRALALSSITFVHQLMARYQQHSNQMTFFFGDRPLECLEGRPNQNSDFNLRLRLPAWYATIWHISRGLRLPHRNIDALLVLSSKLESYAHVGWLSSTSARRKLS